MQKIILDDKAIYDGCEADRIWGLLETLDHKTYKSFSEFGMPFGDAFYDTFIWVIHIHTEEDFEILNRFFKFYTEHAYDELTTFTGELSKDIIGTTQIFVEDEDGIYYYGTPDQLKQECITAIDRLANEI